MFIKTLYFLCFIYILKKETSEPSRMSPLAPPNRRPGHAALRKQTLKNKSLVNFNPLSAFYLLGRIPSLKTVLQ